MSRGPETPSPPATPDPPRPPGPAVEVEGIAVHPFTVATLHEYLLACIRAPVRARVLNVNVNAMNLAYRRPRFRKELTSAEAVFCDGEGVRLAARILGRRLPPRITYADWMWQLAAWGAAEGVRFFFLGAEPGVAAEAARRLRERHPRLQVVGVQHGFWRRDGLVDEAVVERLNQTDPDVLLLGLGMPMQELWLGRHWPNLTARVGLTGGACFDFISGNLARCPPWMRRHGLEWLYRLGQEPVRLFGRYVLGNPWFLSRILARALATRLRG